MRNLFAAGVLVLTGGVGIAMADGSVSDGDVRAIEALYADWRDAVERADIEAYVALLHPDVRLLPPGAASIDGAASYARFLEPVFAAANYRIEVVHAPEIDVAGELAVAEYEYVIHLTLKDPSAGISEPGALTAERSAARYFDVLRKMDDGRWGVWRHFWQDPAPPAGSAR